MAAVTCGESRLQETLTMMKSACIFTQSFIHFHIFTEEDVKQQLEKEVGVILPLNLNNLSNGFELSP